MVDIIIVRFNQKILEDACIKSVLDNTEDYELTVHNNYPKNENLGQLWNRLIANSRCEYICLLGSDTLVYPYWLKGLLGGFFNERVGAVGPVTNICDNADQKIRKARFPSYRETSDLGGFCILFPKSVWHTVGGFPKDFPLFIYRLKSKVFNLVIAEHVYIWHKDYAPKLVQVNDRIRR